MISVTVKLFAAYRDAFQTEELRLELAETACAADVLEQLLRDRPELERWRTVTRFGINLNFVPPETRLQAGDEVVLIPPVSGG
ncbi:MAG: MoaD/ThiS family protein [Spirulinaceae cyanobacterium RM2_2_10]|nr:MoaD/ThiS family protein [Spirulinaceae cyanobacterium SM2_1_0]NJO21429.1 MoaD/ThiS family protein [Spirulinaceae cyanobacterium RM2_2_10]